jgi:hypothetical protein
MIDYLKVNQKLYDKMWSNLKVLAIKRNSMIEDETGEHKFKKMKGFHRCIGCKEWHPINKTIKIGNNYYGLDCVPKKGREYNRFGKAKKVEGQKKVRLFHSLHEYN